MTEDRTAYTVALSAERYEARLDELADGPSNDTEIAGLRDLADEMWGEANRLAGINSRLCRDHNVLLAQLANQPVYVKVDDWKWCHRHNGPIELVGRRCLTWDTDDPGPCGRSPLYVEALDP
jgi:hypothetical protein